MSPVQPVQCGAATMASVAHAAIESLYLYESEGRPWVRISLFKPDKYFKYNNLAA
jgi:hypothetical protein